MRRALESVQLQKLQTLLATVLRHNSFYAAKLREARVADDLASLQEFTNRVPFTSKQELVDDQAAHPPFGSNLSYPMERYTRFHQTSGTTGVPMRWLDTPESWEWMVHCWTRVYRAAQTTAADRVFFPFSFGPFLGFWVAFEAATRIGALAISGGNMRSASRLQAILDNQVTVLCSTPSYAIRLAEIAAEEKIDLRSGNVRTIIVAGEAGGSIATTRSLIERLWHGAQITDHHGMTEIGPVTYECPVRSGVLHIIEAEYFSEVIDRETGEAVEPGSTGELVLTNLGRLGSPLLRYRTGDIVRRSQQIPCRCGSFEMALEGGILGRSDDMVIIRGVNVFPSSLEDILRAHGVAEFQIEVHARQTLTELSIQIEPAAGDAGFAGRIAASIQNALGFRALVSCVPNGSLPRFEGKSKRWTRRNAESIDT